MPLPWPPTRQLCRAAACAKPLPLPAGVPRRRCRTGGRELVAWCYSREWGVGLPGWTPGLRGGGSRSGGGVRRGVRCGGERESERDQRESV